MTKVKVEHVAVTRLSCEKCGKVWHLRFERPAVCPKCKARINWRVVELTKPERANTQLAPTTTAPSESKEVAVDN